MNKRGRPRKYDWLHLFARGKFSLKRGRDYNCSTSAICQQLRNAASALDLHIKVIDAGGGRIDVEINGGADANSQQV